jgi:D-glycero-alpha-D-manno-heptose-7-phosphate kinase
MIVRSKAPLRLGLAGGGTDVSPYSDTHGGCVLNVTINMFAHCTIETIDSGRVEFLAKDMGASFESAAIPSLRIEGELILHKAIYNRVVSEFNQGQALSVRVTTFSDAPPGSGLGSSSTMVVAMLAAYKEWLGIPLSEYDLAHLAFVIERIDCGLVGGKQDQYAATFGGFNFMEFYRDDRVIVNPLRIRRHIENELQSRLMLYSTGVSRESASIIEDQIRATRGEDDSSYVAVGAMHEVKRLAFEMKEKLLKGEFDGMVSLFNTSWDAKKKLSKAISNNQIERVAHAALGAGADAVKISGAGGGGFMMLFVDPVRRLEIIDRLSGMGGEFRRFQFIHTGAEAWRVR